MNKLSVKITAIVLCAVLCLSGAITAFALTGDKKEEPTRELTTVSAENKDEEISKDETVYVLAGADGRVKKIIVSDWIKNALGASSLTDTTGLSDIENVKGDETYTMDGNTKVWDAQGNDIYYQGNIEKELPVEMTVTYTLDGKKVSADEISGKTGKISIRFDYDNRQVETVKIDGKDEKIYVPFAMLTGMLLDNDCFRNVEVTNGKLINDGDRTAVVGIALPGLQENLGISKDKIDIPDYVEITADVTNFRLGITFTVVTNEVFSDMDITELASVNDLTAKLGTLTDSLTALTDGMNQLYDGTGSLLAGSNEISAGIGQLSDGLNMLCSNNSALNGGAKQVFETLLNAANEQIKASGVDLPVLTIENYASVLNSAIGMTSRDGITAAAEQEVESAVRAKEADVRIAVTAAVRSEAEAKVKAAVKQSVLEQVLAAKEIPAEAYAALPESQRAQLDAAVEQQMASAEITALIQTKTEEQMTSESVKALIDSKTEEQIQTLIQQNMASDEVQTQINAGIAKASAGAESLRSLKAQLDSYNGFYQGLLSYTAGVASAASGAAQLNASMPQFVAGVQQLQNGVKQMLDGLNSADLSDLNLEGISNRLKATAETAKHYQNFSGISDEMDGQVRFIYRTDEITSK